MNTRGEERLLLVGMGVMGAPYLRAAQERGWCVTVLDTPYNMRYSGVDKMLRDEDDVITVTGSTEEHWYAAASGIRRRFNAVQAFSEPHVLPAALIAEQLKLPGPGLRAAVISRNKAYQRALFADWEIPQPRYAIIDDADQAHHWAHGRYPVVGKPVSESGSSGVRILYNESELKEWLAAPAVRRPFLLESFVEGPEFSIEALVCHGEIIFANFTRKYTTEPPYCVETEHRAPADVSPPEKERMTAMLSSAVQALGCQYCIVHLELRLEGGFPCIMETAVRTPGDHLMEVIGLAHGIDMFDAALMLTEGRRPHLPTTPPRAAACWFPTTEPGRITAIRGVEDLRNEPGTEMVRIYAEPGTVMNPVRSSSDRLGVVIVSASNAADCERRLTRAKQMLQVMTNSEVDGSKIDGSVSIA